MGDTEFTTERLLEQANELIFRKIADYLGLSLEVRRDGEQLRFTLAKP
jgi:hypothetical protein